MTKYLTPPSLGRLLLLSLYWLVILTMLWSNVLLGPDSPIYAYKWEIVGFRAAWVSVTQIPLVYCLSCKINLISIITGISYERLNWLHRWVARTLFMTVIVHWAYFFQEWTLADFVQLELKTMPMVKYGFAAWALIGWMMLSGLGYFRAQQYEIFRLLHIASAAVLLWLVYVHVPAYARYNVWLAIAFVAVDRLGRAAWLLVRNLTLSRRLHETSTKARVQLAWGYSARLAVRPGGYTQVTIPDVRFRWRPGQHVYIAIPAVGLVDSHPFTIANHPSGGSDDQKGTVELYIKSHTGFTRRLHRKAEGLAGSGRSVRLFLSGPWGTPPSMDGFETVILLGASSGVSFTLPIFQQIAMDPRCVRNVAFNWIVRDARQLAGFRDAILSAVSVAEQHGVVVRVGVFVTGASSPSAQSLAVGDDASLHPVSLSKCLCCSRRMQNDPAFSHPVSSIDADASYRGPAIEPGRLAASILAAKQPDGIMIDEKGVDDEKAMPSLGGATGTSPGDASLCCSPRCFCEHPCVSISDSGRPIFETLIRPPVEQAYGETAIVGCGGTVFTSDLRNYVSQLSDERAVHKGTGAQGLFLFTESFGW